MNTSSNLLKIPHIVSTLVGACAVLAIAWMASDKIAALHTNIITSDSLFLPLLYEERFFGSRLPSSSFLFPDFLYYAILHSGGASVVDAVIIAGLIQCAITTMLVA